VLFEETSDRVAFGKIAEIYAVTHIQEFDPHRFPGGTEIDWCSAPQQLLSGDHRDTRQT